MTITFLLGGARSGKSTCALELAEHTGQPVVFIATATAGDADMADRIARHREERPADWSTVEAPLDLVAAIVETEPEPTLIIDCVTMWVSNHFLAGTNADPTPVAQALAARSGATIVVSNEVGMGVVPGTEMGRDFRDELGRVNRTLSLAADRAVLLVAGRMLELEHPTHFGDLS